MGFFEVVNNWYKSHSLSAHKVPSSQSQKEAARKEEARREAARREAAKRAEAERLRKEQEAKKAREEQVRLKERAKRNNRTVEKQKQVDKKNLMALRREQSRLNGTNATIDEYRKAIDDLRFYNINTWVGHRRALTKCLEAEESLRQQSERRIERIEKAIENGEAIEFKKINPELSSRRNGRSNPALNVVRIPSMKTDEYNETYKAGTDGMKKADQRIGNICTGLDVIAKTGATIVTVGITGGVAVGAIGGAGAAGGAVITLKSAIAGLVSGTAAGTTVSAAGNYGAAAVKIAQGKSRGASLHDAGIETKTDFKNHLITSIGTVAGGAVGSKFAPFVERVANPLYKKAIHGAIAGAGQQLSSNILSTNAGLYEANREFCDLSKAGLVSSDARAEFFAERGLSGRRITTNLMNSVWLGAFSGYIGGATAINPALSPLKNAGRLGIGSTATAGLGIAAAKLRKGSISFEDLSWEIANEAASFAMGYANVGHHSSRQSPAREYGNVRKVKSTGPPVNVGLDGAERVYTPVSFNSEKLRRSLPTRYPALYELAKAHCNDFCADFLPTADRQKGAALMAQIEYDMSHPQVLSLMDRFITQNVQGNESMREALAQYKQLRTSLGLLPSQCWTELPGMARWDSGTLEATTIIAGFTPMKNGNRCFYTETFDISRMGISTRGKVTFFHDQSLPPEVIDSIYRDIGEAGSRISPNEWQDSPLTVVIAQNDAQVPRACYNHAEKTIFMSPCNITRFSTTPTHEATHAYAYAFLGDKPALPDLVEGLAMYNQKLPTWIYRYIDGSIEGMALAKEKRSIGLSSKEFLDRYAEMGAPDMTSEFWTGGFREVEYYFGVHLAEALREYGDMIIGQGAGQNLIHAVYRSSCQERIATINERGETIVLRDNYSINIDPETNLDYSQAKILAACLKENGIDPEHFSRFLDQRHADKMNSRFLGVL